MYCLLSYFCAYIQLVRISANGLEVRCSRRLSCIPRSWSCKRRTGVLRLPVVCNHEVCCADLPISSTIQHVSEPSAGGVLQVRNSAMTTALLVMRDCAATVEQSPVAAG